jgi:hypothetical protein
VVCPIEAKEVWSVPLTYWELEKTIGAFGNLMAVVLGVTHPLTLAYTNMWKMLTSGMREELHAAINYRGYVKPTHVLHSIQLICHQWFSHKHACLNPPNPDFVSNLNQILLQVYILPRLLSALYQLAYPRQQKPLHDKLPPGLIATGSVSGTSATDVSTVKGLASALTAGSSQRGQPGTTMGHGAFMSNLQLLVSLLMLDKPTLKLLDIIANTSPSKMDNGMEMCISYHLCGGCWSTCKCA